MTKSDFDDILNSYLPPWAIGLADPEKLQAGTQLCTRDGRRFGNAHILDSRESRYQVGETVYSVLTDAGNLMVMSAKEIAQGFYPPRYIANLDEVKQKFMRLPAAV
jgi:hypothetical protein